MSQDADGVVQAYRAPAEDDSEHEASTKTEHTFFVVSLPKLVVLDVLTFTLYSRYWFYRHWSQLKRRHFMNVMPLLRAIFPIFFANQLFKTFDYEARKANYAPRWQPSMTAVAFIGLSVLENALVRIGGPVSLLLSVGTSVGTAFTLSAAQKVANLASGDPEGTSNAKWGPGAIIAAAVGLVVWALALFGELRGE